MKSLLSQLFTLLSSREKRNLIILAFLMIFNALIEVFGIASIAPLIAVITNPESMDSVPFIGQIKEYYDFKDHREFSIFLAVAVLIIITLSNAVTFLTSFLSLKFANNREHTIGIKLMTTYLHQTFIFFLGRHSAEILRNILNEIAFIVSNIIMQSLNFLSRSISMLAIIIFLFVISPKVTFIIGFILGGAYLLIYLFLKAPLQKYGEKRLTLAGDRLQIISESVNVIKDIKIQNIEPIFLNSFDDVARRYARVRTFSDVAGIAPKYVIEVFAIMALVTAIIILVSTHSDSATVLPILGIYAFAGIRLMPALQQIFIAASKIQFSKKSLEVVASELKNLGPTAQKNIDENEATTTFKNNLGLKDVSFKYKEDQTVLSHINLDITEGQKIGLVGKSGSGKSTIIDLLVGLIEPNSGYLYTNGNKIEPGAYKSWRNNIAYTSQHIYLLDDTLDMNITLEPDNKQRDQERLRNAKTLALIDFEDHIDGTIGENGQRLSGGQRQRIGLARAFYQNKPLLILDEATSALDAETEKRLLENVKGLNQTLIFITHRVETLSFCDEIHIVADGKILESGSYKDLEKSSEKFQEFLKEEKTK